MEKPLLLVLSDLHVRNGGEWLFSSRPFIRNDLISSFNQVNDLIKRLKPRGVVICGDIFHSSMIQSGDLNLLIQLINACKSVKSQIFYVQGQHDKAEPRFFSLLDPSAIYLHQRKVEFEGVTIVGLDYMRKGLIEALEDLPYADIFVTHQCWKRSKKSLFGEVLVQDLCENFKITISGDIHTHCLINLEHNEYIIPEHETVYNFSKAFISPGSICYQKIDDTRPFGVFTLSGSLSITSYHLQVRPVIHLRFNTDQQVLAYLKKDLHKELDKTASLPQEISKPIFIIKSSSTLSSLEDFKMSVGENAFVFLATETLKYSPKQSNPDHNSDIDDIIADVFVNNVYRSDVERLFRAAQKGLDTLKQEIKVLEEEVTDVARKEVDAEELLSA